MNMTNTFKNSFRNVLTVAALSTTLGLGLSPAFADTAQPPSDGVVSTLKDAGITTKVKAKLMADSGLEETGHPCQHLQRRRRPERHGGEHRRKIACRV